MVETFTSKVEKWIKQINVIIIDRAIKKTYFKALTNLELYDETIDPQSIEAFHVAMLLSSADHM